MQLQWLVVTRLDSNQKLILNQF